MSNNEEEHKKEEKEEEKELGRDNEEKNRKWVGFVKKTKNIFLKNKEENSANEWVEPIRRRTSTNSKININNYGNIVEMEENNKLGDEIDIYSIIANSEELLIQIFGYLPYTTLCQSIVLVCCKWKRISEDNQIWLDLCNKYAKSEVFSYLFLNSNYFWHQNCYQKLKKRISVFNKISFEKSEISNENFKNVFYEELFLMEKAIKIAKKIEFIPRNLKEFDSMDGVHIYNNSMEFNDFRNQKLKSTKNINIEKYLKEIKKMKNSHNVYINNKEYYHKLRKEKMNLKYDIKKKSHPLFPQKLGITDDKWETIVKKFINNGSIYYPSASFQSFHYNDDPIITIENIRNSFLNGNNNNNNQNSKNKKNNKNNNNNNNNNNDLKKSKLPKISFFAKEEKEKCDQEVEKKEVINKDLKMSLVGGGGIGSKTGFVIQFVQGHFVEEYDPTIGTLFISN